MVYIIHHDKVMSPAGVIDSVTEGSLSPRTQCTARIEIGYNAHHPPMSYEGVLMVDHQAIRLVSRQTPASSEMQ